MSEAETNKLQNGGAPTHGGRRQEAARLYGIPREELLDFSSSINPFGPPAGVMSAIRAAATEISYYPEEDPVRLMDALSAYLGISSGQVVPGNGSTEIIYWLATVLAPKRILIVEPTFSEYRRACLAAGALCDSLQLSESENFALDTRRIEPEGYDLVFICNPNNPTGYLAPLDDIVRLWRRCRSAGTGLVVDEAFIDLAAPGESILSNGVSRGLYVIRSVTKSHALAGLRLGCLAADADFARMLRSRMPPWNINSYAIAAAIEALADSRYLTETRSEIAQLRAALFSALSKLPGIEPLPSEANYLLCRLYGIGAREITDRLARMGILVRDCRSFMGLGNRYIRVAVRTGHENHQLVSAISRALMDSAGGTVPGAAGSRWMLWGKSGSFDGFSG